MEKLLILALLIAALSQISESKSFFTVISPKEIFPNSIHKITIIVEPGSSGPTTFNATIFSDYKVNPAGNGIDPIEIIVSKQIELDPGSTSVLELPVSNLPNSYYNLTIQSENEEEEKFVDSTRLHVDRMEKSILIQTDKQIYKPGETINFRIIVLDRFFKPIECSGGNASVEVKLLDAERNVIKIWKDGTTVKGLMSGKLELSPQPNLGQWKLEAKVGSVLESQTFTIAQYILPKFKVDVSLPPYISMNSSDFKATVNAKYTYGQGLKGDCVVTLNRKFSRYDYRFANRKIISKTVPINGLAIVDFSGWKEEFGSEFADGAEFEVLATVRDTITGFEGNSTNSVKLYEHPYKIEYVDKPGSYQPGLPLKMSFKVTTPDHIPIQDPNPKAFKIQHGFSYSEREAFVESAIPANGIVSVSFITPANELLTVQYVIVTYKTLTQRLNLPSKMQSSSGIFMQLHLLTTNPIVNEELELSLTASKEFSSFNYIIYGRGLILESGSQKLEQASATHNFKLMAPEGAAPEGRIVVYAMFDSTHEILADSITLRLGSILKNKLDISLSSQTLEPGQNLEIRMKTKENSLVTLRGVDQSLLLLKPDKDINMGAIEEKLKKLEKDRNNRNRLSSGSSAFQVFERAGLTVITNGHLERHRHSVIHMRPHARGGARINTAISDYDDDDEELTAVRKTARKKKKTSTSSNEESGIRIRKNFPETWLWEEFSLSEGNDSLTINRIVPDTLTSWIISGYSLNTEFGIGVALQPQTLTTFRPFFITLNLPYSVVKGEELSLQVLVHNYMSEKVNAKITLRNDANEFDFVDNKVTNEIQMEKEVEVGASEVASVAFVIIPTKFGAVMLNVKGVGNEGMAGDALVRPLTVKPPGQQQIQNKAVLIDLRTEEAGTKNNILTLDFPEKRVIGADEVKITVIGDLLGTTISNLDKLLKMPCGCGEQNMLNFVPDIVILDYLTAANLLTPEIKTKAIKFLESGYQRELTYRHHDGSFSAFGKSDASGSTWLTAFVARSFIAARPYITVDEKIILDALGFLSGKQTHNGNFQELGRVIHSDMQGGAGGVSAALSAYTLLAFVESKGMTNGKYSKQIENGLQYISEFCNGGDLDLYSLSLISYTLQLAGHEKKDTCFGKLKARAKKQSDLVFWDQSNEEDSTTKPVNVEMTSYAMLTYVLRENSEEVLPIGKWLLKQRNAEGGFLSTQDTVVGLTALARFAKYFKGNKTDIRIKAEFGEEFKEIVVQDSNAIVLQEFYLPSSTRWVNFYANGTGTALAQVTWSYYVEEEKPLPAFVITATATATPSSTLNIRVCAAYTAGEESNMAVIEVNLLSGYNFEAEELNMLSNIPKLKRHDLENAGTKLILYFDSIDQSNNCFDIGALRLFKIDKQAPALVFIYDYYDTTRSATTFYNI